MVYLYSCPKCNVDCDVVKPVKDFDRIEIHGCGQEMKRAVAPTKLYFSGTKVQDARWSPALGCTVRGDSHERQLAKDKGMIELGNERPEKHLKPNIKPYDY